MKSKLKIGSQVLISLILLGILFCSCSTAPKHLSLRNAKLPDLVPIREFFINTDSNFGYRVSPDGKKIAWIGVKNRRTTIFYRTIGKNDIKVIDTHSQRNIYALYWVQDNQQILYHQDQKGNENYHIYLVDTKDPAKRPIDLTPFEETRAGIHRIIRADPDHILIEHNQRDKSCFDLYKVNLKTHQQVMVAQNPGDVFNWITDDDGNLLARVKKEANKKRVLEFSLPLQNTWEKIITWNLGDTVSVLGFTHDKKGMWMTSNRGLDRVALVLLDIKTGKENLIYEDSQVDIQTVQTSYLTKKPLLALSNPDYPKLHFFDSKLKAELNDFQQQGKVGLNIMSVDNQERLLTLSVYTDKGVDYYLFNRDNRKKVLLGRHAISPYAQFLSRMQPISFKSRDGLTLNGYLTLPKGTSGKKLPIVLYVHGGPWSRDLWGYNSTVQFLANRGYAVLQINYRGSIGYGRAFEEAAVGEFAGKMHDDLIDGVQWVIQQGIADPNKVGIYGGSYGGYATLVGLTFTPETFACGVDVVGPSNLVSLMESVPKYWKPWMEQWYKYVGDPNNPDDRRIMEVKSPLFQVAQIKRPLLIAQGGNDPRVKQNESDQIVSALRKSGKDVEYILFPDEGHGFRHWKNRLVFYRKVEDFFANHLGGRSAGFDYYELGLFVF